MSLRRSLYRRALASGAALVLGVPWACGTPERPPELGVLRVDAGDGADVEHFQPTAPTELSCNLGPDGGVCACADQPLLVDPPNLYFVLDRSASMAEDDKWHTIVSVIGTLVIDLGPRAVVGAAVFPGPQSNSCAPGVEVSAPHRGDSPAGQAGPTATALIDQLQQLAPVGGTPTAVTLQSLLANNLSKLSGKTYVILATDGGPNCNATAACNASQCEINIQSSFPACTPGGSDNCCADPRYGTAESCLDSQPTTDAVKAIADSGIPVYVVGVPGSAPYAALLDELATAGNTARSSEPLYYSVDTADVTAFTSALFGIAARITGSCTLSLDQPPPDPTKVNVFLDEQVLPQAGADGWTLDGQTVTLLGKSCQSVLDGNVIDVRVVAGCPTFFR